MSIQQTINIPLKSTIILKFSRYILEQCVLNKYPLHYKTIKRAYRAPEIVYNIIVLGYFDAAQLNLTSVEVT